MTLSMSLAEFRKTYGKAKKKKQFTHRERPLQISCYDWFSIVYPQYKIHHSPNGGSRFKREANFFKAMGVQAGFPDFILLVAMKGYHGFFCELKIGSNPLSKEQKAFKKYLEAQGYYYCTAKTLDEFMKHVNFYLR